MEHDIKERAYLLILNLVELDSLDHVHEDLLWLPDGQVVSVHPRLADLDSPLLGNRLLLSSGSVDEVVELHLAITLLVSAYQLYPWLALSIRDLAASLVCVAVVPVQAVVIRVPSRVLNSLSVVAIS